MYSRRRTSSRRLPAIVGLVLALAVMVPTAPASAGKRPLKVVATATSPEQSVVVELLEDGTTAQGTFESRLQVLSDGSARGRARLSYQAPPEPGYPSAHSILIVLDYEKGKPHFERYRYYVSWSAQGRQCVSGVCQEGRVTGTVQPHASSPECLIYDVVGPLVRDVRVDAIGTLVLAT